MLRHARHVATSDHHLQFYGDDSFLAHVVGQFLTESLSAGDRALVIASCDHQKQFRRELVDAGMDVDLLVRHGELSFADVDAMLEQLQITDDGDVNATKFRHHVGGLLEHLSRGGQRQVSAYGELVDVLSRRGNTRAARQVEVLWNQLREEYDFSLLCGYSVDALAHDPDGASVDEIFRQHDSVTPAEPRDVEYLVDAPYTKPSPTGLRVLVVDDNVDSAETMALLLGSEGHDVQMAYDGQEALDVAEAFRPHVVLLDIGLPVKSGLEVARALRREPWAAHVTIIAMSGWGRDADRQSTREAGFDHHLVKPIDHDALRRLLPKEH
jgi:CheY-like chemotaxis protein